MNAWALHSVSHAIRITGSRKLISFHRARTAGIHAPDDAVLLRESFQQAEYWSASESDRARLCTLAEQGHGKIVLRNISNGDDKLWRAIETPLAKVETLANRLICDSAAPHALYIQAHWPGRHTRTARTITLIATGRDLHPQLTGAYQTSLSGAVSPFREDDRDWLIVAEAHRQLEAVMGICFQVVFGLSDNTLTLLSIRQAPLHLATQIKASVSLVERQRSAQGAAIAAISDALDTAGSQCHILNNHLPVTPMRGQSIGDRWGTGRLAFSSATQAKIIAAGDPVILVRLILRVEDCALFRDAAGVVSIADGVSSHFVLLANSLQKPCLVNMASARIHEDQAILTSDDLTLKEGDWATIDERQSTLLPGKAQPLGNQMTLPPAVLCWANSLREDQLLVNCEEPTSAAAALVGGADGIGLCRSERHLVASPKALEAFQRMITTDDEHLRAEAVLTLGQVLGLALEELLAAVPGKQVAYRLLEPDEVLRENGCLEPALSGAVGPSAAAITYSMSRGEAFRNHYSFLYEAQIRCAIQAAENVARTLRCAIELSVIVPMVSDPDEYKCWRNIIRVSAASIASNSMARVIVRTGTMIETPRAALLAKELAQLSDVLLIGTNDLTALVWGLDRSGTYSIHGTIDPFARFDAIGVGRLLTQAICEARAANPNIRITICGSHASVRRDVDSLLDTGAQGLSCQIDAIPRMALQLACRTERLKGHLHPGLPIKSVAARRSAYTLGVAMALRSGAGPSVPPTDLGPLAEWAQEITEDLSLPWSGIWKFFKRDLVVHWFGPREARRFMPGWRIEQALEYALSLEPKFNTRIRYSVFPADIACRASSDIFPVTPSWGTWRAVLQRLDPNVAIEIFPQQPVNRITFRAVLHDMILSVEGAPGQAIDIFWKAPQELSKFTYDGCTERIFNCKGAIGFDKLFKPHLRTFFAQSQSLRDYLGAEWISLEGYAGPTVETPLFVADLDLPLDGVLISNSLVAEI